MMSIPAQVASHKRKNTLILLISILLGLSYIFTGSFVWLVISLLLLNMYGFILMGIDKRKAREKSKFRIPENSFFQIALLFGSLGITLGMMFFHHKTWHPSFRWIPILIPVHSLLIFWLI